MKEFEKWNKIYRINDVRLLTEPDINIKEKQRRKGWEAALEWVLGEVDSLNLANTFSTVGEAYISVICNIQKELEE